MTELRLTFGWVADATSGEVVSGDPNAGIGEVTTDSRTLREGDFFVALRGPRHDGHDHVIAALKAGASGALVEMRWWRTRAAAGSGPEGTAGIVAVDDTLVGLQGLARAVRAAVKTEVVAITGSAGKTTTKEVIASMLASRFSVVKNRGNLNNHIGLPLSLMELRREPDVAVMELGMNHRGEISTLVAIADPNVRVWTNVGDAHLGFFESADAIADAKAEILENADATDVLVCNADDQRVMARTHAFPGRIITFGYAEGASVRAIAVDDGGVSGMRARLLTPAGERALQTPLLGRGNLSNILAAAAVALHYGVSLDQIVECAGAARPADRRGAVHTVHGITVIDDSYNSSPSALFRALDVLHHEPSRGRKVAVLGEMLELGAHADALHRQSGVKAASTGVGLLVTVGGHAARVMAEAALEAGMPAETVRYVERSEEAADLLSTVARPGDIVLVKGSRGIHTDVVVDRLLAGGA